MRNERLMPNETITFRPETDDDADLLYRIYASTRVDEMKMLDWSDLQKEGFVRMQFRAQTQHYKQFYSDGEFLIILRDGQPIGRLYLHQEPNDLRIIDITLLAEYRGSGIGGKLLRDLMDRCAATGDALSIHVEQFNPALRLYKRLGFQEISTYGVYYLMEWRATPSAKAPAIS